MSHGARSGSGRSPVGCTAWVIRLDELPPVGVICFQQPSGLPSYDGVGPASVKTQDADPDAMRGDFGEDSVEKVAESPYFGLLERRNFRNWMPITREGLISMVVRRPAVARLDPAARGRLVREVGALYDAHARAPDPLMLPFQTSCWRAEVDHSKLVIDDDFDDVLQIKL